jgi:hypothetical protein
MHTPEVIDGSFMWIWYFGKYSAFMRVVLYENGKKVAKCFGLMCR